MCRPLSAVTALAGAVALASCGLAEQVSGGGEAAQQEAMVVVLVPEGTASGEGVSAAVETALAETTAGVDGWTVEVQTVDDRADEESSLAEIAGEIADDDVVAVIGGLSTETVRVVQPVFEQSSLLFVSPADTLPEHTRGADVGDPVRPYETYFRTAVSDDGPLYALARHAVSALGVATVAVIDAGGDGGADVFAEAVREAGGEVLRVDERDDADDGPNRDKPPRQDADAGNDGDTGNDRDTNDGQGDDGQGDGGEDEAGVGPRGITEADVVPMLNEAADQDADAVFVSGSSDVAAEVADQVASLGLDLEVLGDTVVTSENFLAEAGSSAEGAWTALPGELGPTEGAHPDQLDALMSDSSAEPGQYGAAAYDAGTAVGTVLARCLPPASSAHSAREGCLGEMAELTLQGVTGEVDFDRFGDRVGARPVLITVQDGTWTQAGEVP